MSDEEVSKEDVAEEAPQEEVVDEGIPKEKIEEAVQRDYAPELLERAKAMGGYDPNHEKGLSPGEWIRNKSFFKKIDVMNKRINDLTTQIQEAQKRGYEEGLKALDAQRHAAVEYGNVEEFKKIDAQMQDIQNRMNATTAAIVTDPAVIEFNERNKDWVYADTAKGKIIYDKVMDFSQNLPSYLTPAERVDQVEEYVKLSFPERNKTEPVSTPKSAVAPGHSPSVKSSGKSSYNDLDQYQQEAYTRIKATNPKFTVSDYLDLFNRYQ